MARKATEKDEYSTPKEILSPVRDALGGRFDLDPASNGRAQGNVGAMEFYSRRPAVGRAGDDGLALAWRGVVWLNPPYSDPRPWVEKLVMGWRIGMVPAGATILTATAVFGTQYGASLLAESRLVVSVGRVAFLEPAKGMEPATQPRDGSVVVLGGQRLDTSAAFARARRAMRRWPVLVPAGGRS